MKPKWPRRLTIAAVLAIPTAIVLWLSLDRSLYKERFNAYSVYRTANDGMSLSYRYLAGRREQTNQPGVSVLSRPLEFAQVPANGTIFRIAPSFVPAEKRKKKDPDEFAQKVQRQQPPSPPAPPATPPAPNTVIAEENTADFLTPYEVEWIENGGRLVLAVHTNHGPLKTEAPTAYEKVQRVHPFLTGITQIEPLTLRRLNGWVLAKSHTLLASGSDVLAARWILGKGEVVMLSCPEIFRNDTIGNGQHLLLLEVLAGDGRAVFFDEMVHGLRTDLGVLELLTRWGLGPLICFGLLLCFLYYWRQRAGIGPPVDEYRETRRAAVDLVDSMAAVYQRELPRWEALQIYRKELMREAALETDHRGKELETFVSKLMRGESLPERAENKDLTQQQLEKGLDSLNEAFRRLHDAKSRNAIR